ncbi:MAG: metal-binding protein [Okeania sp. SIO2F4]|uniref:metal-binding protein n=1 Tax=Okeania sp. SIO2F4 TaxID=2607790 RepID=UPI001429A2A8|nr:metal-binding protein [Okeania sp. SIO2F4]NES07448.1 metal-binding protein [Okeania sp. SIO2F4]
MPSGSTHDRITLWSLPIITGLSFGLVRSTHLTLFVSGGFLFSGLMFGPDLDINSRQFQRWGWFKWLWRPYQSSLNHRSFLSHGPIIGTALRLLYLLTLFLVLVVLGLIIDQLLSSEGRTLGFVASLWRSLSLHYQEVIALLVGIELGAMSHSVSDWSSSAYKRFKTKGLSGLLPQIKLQKRQRKPTRKSSSSKVVASGSRHRTKK